MGLLYRVSKTMSYLFPEQVELLLHNGHFGLHMGN